MQLLTYGPGATRGEVDTFEATFVSADEAGLAFVTSARDMAQSGSTLRVEGYQDVMRAFARADKDTKRNMRAAFRDVGDVVKRDAAVEHVAGQPEDSGRLQDLCAAARRRRRAVPAEDDGDTADLGRLPDDARAAAGDGRQRGPHRAARWNRRSTRSATTSTAAASDGPDRDHRDPALGRQLRLRPRTATSSPPGSGAGSHDHSTYLPLTIEDGFGDPRLLTVFAAIALTAGRQDRRTPVPGDVRAAVGRPVRGNDQPANRDRPTRG